MGSFHAVEVKPFVSDVAVSCLPPTILNYGRAVDEIMRRMDSQPFRILSHASSFSSDGKRNNNHKTEYCKLSKSLDRRVWRAAVERARHAEGKDRS